MSVSPLKKSFPSSRDDLPDVVLRPGREKTILRGHPWVFSNALAEEPEIPPGQLVRVLDAQGRVLGTGTHNHRSGIRIRLYRFGEGPVDVDFLAEQVARAVGFRQDLYPDNFRVGRLIFGESDGLPGFVLDRYNEVYCLQVSTRGAEMLKPLLLEALDRHLNVSYLIERSDLPERTKEGAPPWKGVLRGKPNLPTVVRFPGGMRLEADPLNGQKTGLYLDQADNWERVARYAANRHVLNCFSYTGAFGIAAARRGATSVLHMDTSRRALEAAERNVRLNATETTHEYLHEDVIDAMRRFKREERGFGLVVLDPPPLAKRSRDLKGALRMQQMLHQAALDVLEPGGLLATFSCSGAVTPAILQGNLQKAAVLGGKNLQLLDILGAASDHPLTLHFPEARYLTGLIARRW
jgi:23S rRNA (cytosine1962-C5)-methyltransferase